MITSVQRLADRMLEAAAPRSAAAAQYCLPTGETCAFCGCYGSRASYKQKWLCADGKTFCSNACEITRVC